MTPSGLPPLHDGVVLAGVKATPFGWPPASLDPGSGRRRQATSGSPRGFKLQPGSTNLRSLRFQGIAG